MDLSAPRLAKRLTAVAFSLAVLAWLGYTAWQLTGSPASWEGFANLVLFNAAIALAGVACLIRGLPASTSRWAWIAFGVGLLFWAAADTYWVAQDMAGNEVPYPSVADVGFLAALPCFYVGIGILIRHRIGHLSTASWLDGATAALAAGALGTAILAPALVGLTKGEAATVITNLSYPVGDILLVAFIIGAIAMSGWRGAGALLLLGAGLLIWSVTDSIYLVQVAEGTYAGGLLDHGWLVGSLVIASAALVSISRRTRRRTVYRSAAIFPTLFATIAVAVLVWDHFERVSEVSVWLAAATLVAVLMRLRVSFRENAKLLTALHADSITDPLTGLPNRRQLMEDLEDALRPPVRSECVFAMFDLDGFKTYNDNFGHPAGDDLLKRLGTTLDAAVRGYGRAYRLGGDEFCVLLIPRGAPHEPMIEAARAALRVAGDGFFITASGGVAVLPLEARTPSSALRLSDDRMYAEKGARPGRADRQTRELLARIVRDHQPALDAHHHNVAQLALAVARRLGLEAEERDIVIRAAELHDVGKIAIPDEILAKPGPLDEAEWSLMRKHTMIGERILGMSPAMAPVATAVRSSHERWDGDGYPDGLAAEEIPLASRIIFVCDAFDAMCARRPYSDALPEEEALAELERNSATQFDPHVVETFCGIHRATRGQTNGNGDRPRVEAAGNSPVHAPLG